jgi:hypothetical protein
MKADMQKMKEMQQMQQMQELQEAQNPAGAVPETEAPVKRRKGKLAKPNF